MNHKLTESLEDYIHAIYSILLKKPVCRVTDIKKLMNVSKPSIVHALSHLKELDLIEQEKYGYITLTKKGGQITQKLHSKKIDIKNFLKNIFTIDDDEADNIACGIEHHIPTKISKQMGNINKQMKKKDIKKNEVKNESID